MCTNGINSTIWQSICCHADAYGFKSNLAEDFLAADTSNRGNLFLLAISVVDDIAAKHGKESLFSLFKNLHDFEKSQRNNNEQRGRDHIIHSVTCFFLGIYINEEFLKNYEAYVEPFEWKLASLFHDIAYPLEIDIDKTDYFSKIKKYLSSKHRIKIRSRDEINIVNQHGYRDNSLKLIDKKLESLLDYEKTRRANKRNVNAKKKYDCALMNNDYCHGIFSSLTVLYIAAALYNKNNREKNRHDIVVDNFNFNYTFFENDLLNACTAIFLHNFKLITPRMTMKYSRCAYLLKLCDALQNWSRPKNMDLSSVSPNNYSILIQNNQLYFTAPKSEAEIILNELNNTISMDYINISSAE